MLKLNALIAGSTGYIGVQLIKLLIKHKYINIRYLCGNSSVGKKISFYDKDLNLKRLPKIIKTLKDFYKSDDFVKILKANSLLSTNDVINTNNCFISVCKSKYKNKIVIISAIDNLIKGGAGQAVQNLNMKFKFPIKTAL